MRTNQGHPRNGHKDTLKQFSDIPAPSKRCGTSQKGKNRRKPSCLTCRTIRAKGHPHCQFKDKSPCWSNNATTRKNSRKVCVRNIGYTCAKEYMRLVLSDRGPDHTLMTSTALPSLNSFSPIASVPSPSTFMLSQLRAQSQNPTPHTPQIHNLLYTDSLSTSEMQILAQVTKSRHGSRH